MALQDGVNGSHGVNGVNGLNGDVAAFEPAQYPPFPADLPILDMQTISLAKILKDDGTEKARMLDICKSNGFFYIDFSNTPAAAMVDQAERIGKLAQETFALPVEEKSKFPFQPGTIFGYKRKGLTVTDKNDTPDTAEFFNIAKDQILGKNDRLESHYPQPIVRAQPLLESFARTAHQTGLTLMSALFSQLGLAPESVLELHRFEEPAASQVRLTYGPPRQKAEDEAAEIQTPSHTDFGTITVLFNWLGGLQLWSRSSRGEDEANVVDPNDPDGKWLWLKPKPGHAIINLGEAAAVFTGGVLCAGRHRVIPAPGPQGKYGRYSIVYFVRPEDDAIMRRFTGSDQIPQWKEGESRGVDGWKVKDWVLRQAQGLRSKETAKMLD